MTLPNNLESVIIMKECVRDIIQPLTPQLQALQQLMPLLLEPQ